MFCILFAHSSFRVIRTRGGSSTLLVIAPVLERLLLLLFSGSPLLDALRFLFEVICLSQNKSPSVTAIVDPLFQILASMSQITLLGSSLLDYTLLGFVTQTLILSNLFRFSSVQIWHLCLFLFRVL
ncbi:hypothetical protein NitaMp035 (mitochondrion) [Nicotiana tabacum]|uniref:Uncharacterized protein n=1 Tax=Nicotiana tabacum TaxID=4097 RepID=Q5MA33_TOBAC|nr:hypothetical protein NitaMp035 [Nicotiana tabacum]UYX57549.1 hypothetical protein [Nicotiana tabacum]BAD83445.1 hypothetical protein [Nicotiana tabacum]